MQITSTRKITHGILTALVVMIVVSVLVPNRQTDIQAQDQPTKKSKQSAVTDSFKKQIQPLLKKYCYRCHNVDERESGIRVDQLDGKLEDRHLRLWEGIKSQLADEAMPPEDEPQPTAAERKRLIEWIEQGLIVAKSRVKEKNGSVRRLTVAQYRNTLRDLLKLGDDLTDVLPPDAVSKDGFVNNEQTMLLSPLLIEAYFEIAEKALDRCIVDENAEPSIQNFRMDFGKAINKEPCPDKLILGALSMLLANEDFEVAELTPKKPFPFEPFRMRTKYRFIEGYQGNDTVRGWREYDSIYHAVFACMRGNGGYPKGHPYDTIPEGLLLRPAIPSAELFQVESTYGPKANFKISLRELPDFGRFRVTVKAAKYNDGLLLEPNVKPQPESADSAITLRDFTQPVEVNIPKAGIYQADVYLSALSTTKPDRSKLKDGLVGSWSLDGEVASDGENTLEGKLAGKAKFVDSPFKKAVLFDGNTGDVVIPRDESMNVGEGEFTVAAWIHPRGLRQAGIVCLGGYGYTHGWLLDMPNGKGVLRIETANSKSQLNGTVQSKARAITNNQWQHVAVVVRRGDNKTKLYVNGFEVGSGTINAANLDNPDVSLHIGTIRSTHHFKGEIDEVRYYRRALSVAELMALVEPGKQFVKPPSSETRRNLLLTLGDRHFAGNRNRAFLAVRLPEGPLKVAAQYAGKAAIDRIVLSPLDEEHELSRRFVEMEKRSPRVGVHVGLRRDCGSTLTQVGGPQTVTSTKLSDFVFEGAIANYPSPDVEKDNVNYLAGIREIGVRSEYTDGREMPRLLVRSIEFEGPLHEQWPPATHKNIFIDSQNKNDPATYAREIIRSFASRAFRRPITRVEEDSLFKIWKQSFAAKADFPQSVKDTLLVVLTSPQFLFLIEKSETPKAESLNSHELASKLSYFLWNAAPDDRLLKLAAADKLHESLNSEVQRMIDDGRFAQFIDEFTSQWLSLDKFEVVEVDRKRFPKLTRDTKTELRKEPAQFVRYLIEQNLPVRNLIDSDFIVANEVVANYYDLADRTESGFEFVAIKHGNKNLGGVLSQASILSGLSDGRESNPVKRGAWLARKIIAEPPDDPPPNVPDLEEDTKHLPLRERLAKHRNQPGCAKCHSGIDPWGVPFEEFDAAGLFKKKAVDARSTLPDKTEIKDVNALQDYLANDRIDQVAFSVLKHLTSYAIGRSLTYNEIEFLKEKGVELKAKGYRMQDMILFVVKSKMFLEK